MELIDLIKMAEEHTETYIIHLFIHTIEFSK
jgi:hypothetical protein